MVKARNGVVLLGDSVDCNNNHNHNIRDGYKVSKGK